MRYNIEARYSMKFMHRQHQKGFTLVEIAIVVVIMGLLMGGILGSRMIIRSTQAKEAMVIAEDLRAASTYFRQRYSYLPGDLPVPGAVIAVNPPLVAGAGTNGDGTVDGAVNADGQAAAGSEVAVAPQQLFAANMVGKVDAADPQRRIRSSYGSVHIVSAATANGLVANFTAVGGNPAARNAILFHNLPCDIAQEIDVKMDDGNLNTGRGRASAAGIAACAANQENVVNFFAVPL